MIILIMGLPSSGKTTLAKRVSSVLGAVHWEADAVREAFGTQGQFSIEARIAQAKRMRFLCEQVEASGHIAIADFVCPTEETRAVFSDAVIVWVDRIPPEDSPFEDTRELFTPPKRYDFRYTTGSTVDEVLRVLA